jgi:O-antigen ligase
LRQSVTYAITHPLVGVGPGQFAVAAYGDAVKEGTQSPWLGTHNSYTEVASECGIPAFLLYVSVLVLSLVSNFRIFRRTAGLKDYVDLNALAYCMFSATLMYAICTFFFHIAYSSYLPAIAGMSIALRLGTNPCLWSFESKSTAKNGWQLASPQDCPAHQWRPRGRRLRSRVGSEPNR